MSSPSQSKTLNRRAQLLNFGLLAFLSICVGAAFLVQRRNSDAPRHQGNLSTFLPAGVAGWTATDHPVADTLSMQKAVEGLLNYDDAFLRLYRQGSRELQVYVAWWRPGKMSPVQIAVHNPDHCWTEAGWRLRGDKSGQLERVGGIRVLPGEFRSFERKDTPGLNAIYWLLVGNEVFGYARDAEPLLGLPNRVKLMLKAVWRQSHHEQIYFIRISSQDSVSDILAGPEWQEFIRQLGKLNLAVSSAD